MSRRSKRGDKSWRMPNPKVVARMDAAALCQLLFRIDNRLPLPLARAITARGAEAVESLVAIACDEAPWWDDAVGFWPSRHALILLKQVGDARAVAPLLELMLTLRAQDYFWLLSDGALQALQGIGAPALEPVMAELEDTEHAETQEVLISILAGLGVRDDRIWSLLVAQLSREPDRAALNFTDYGDDAALPLLHKALAAATIRPPTDGDILENRAFIELEGAIIRLGGELTPAEQVRSSTLRSLYRW